MCLQETILEVTYTDPKVKYAIDKQVGRAYSFIQKFGFGQIGSQGFEIVDCSHNLIPSFQDNSDIVKANIELRPKGILIGFQEGYRSYKWILSFEQFDLYLENKALTIQSKNSFLKLQPLHRANLDTRFIKKINKLQINSKNNNRTSY